MYSRGLAITWGRPNRRTIEFAKLLNLKLKAFHDKPPYLKAFFGTIKCLVIDRHSILLLQGTHGPLLLLTLLLKKITKHKLIMDMHSGFIVPFSLKNYVLNTSFRGLLRFVDLLIVHNYHAFKTLPSKIIRKAIVIYDPPLKCDCKNKNIKERVLKIVFPSGGLKDEPINELIKEFNRNTLPDIELYITGPYKPKKIGKVIFTGYLKMSDYLRLLCNANVIIALTKMEYTVLSAAWEALYCHKLLILSNTITLSFIFRDVALFINNLKELNKIIISIRNNNYLKEKIYKNIIIKSMLYKRFYNRQIRELLKKLIALF